MLVSDFTFKPLSTEDLEILCDWLEKPHVLKWWNDHLTRDEIKITYGQRIGDHIVCPFIIYYHDKPIGFIQYYWASKVGDGWWPNEDDHTVGTDQFIGEIDYINKGYGTAMLKAFIEFLFCDPNVHKIMTEADPQNLRAKRCYEKAGFIEQGMVSTPDGESMMMTISR